MAKRHLTLEQRFWAKVDKSGDCWIWTGCRSQLGYGQISGYRAHRVSWQLAHGMDSIPAGMFVCHKCDNPPCVNPAHLFLGTARDNNADRARKGRGVYLRGPAHHQAVKNLDADKVRAILSDPRPRRAVARVFGISPGTVSRIRRKEHWLRVDAVQHSKEQP